MTNTLKQCGSNIRRLLASSGSKPLIYDLGWMHKEHKMKIGRFPGNLPDRPIFICHLSGPSQCPHRHQNPSSVCEHRPVSGLLVEEICKVQAECISVDLWKNPSTWKEKQIQTWTDIVACFCPRHVLKQDARWWYNERPLYWRAAKNIVWKLPQNWSRHLKSRPRPRCMSYYTLPAS